VIKFKRLFIRIPAQDTQVKLYRIHRIQQLPIHINTAWDFFSNPFNLKEITPSSLGFEITSELPSQMYAGMLITYNLTPLFGISRRWITEITHVEAPHRFIDEQRFGPYRFWHHQHLFREIAGGVEMQDIVHYMIPFGWLGRLAAARLVQNQLQKIFDFRRDFLAKKFGTL
jgi:ligand-binding SRPBCC domain-containing protein